VDSTDRLRRVHPAPAARRARERIEELEALDDGWMSGRGSAPAPAAIAALRGLLDRHPILFARSGIFPRIDGSAVVEASGWPLAFEILTSTSGVLTAKTVGDGITIPLETLAERTLAAAIPSRGAETVLVWCDGPIVTRIETDAGPMIACALAEGEAVEWIGVISDPADLAAFAAGKIDLRALHLSPRSLVVVFDEGGPMRPFLDPIPEAWIPDPGLTAADISFDPPHTKDILP
jgi:hypothetical protein